MRHTLAKGAPCAAPGQQKLVAKSSAEAELAASGGGLSQALWAKHFLEEQGCKLSSSTLRRSSQPAMLLEKNGKAPSAKRAREALR